MVPTSPDHDDSPRTVLLFLLIAASNAFLAYGPFAPGTKALVGLLGVALPCWTFYRRLPTIDGIRSLAGDGLFTPPSPVVILTVLAVPVLFRVWSLGKVQVWPMWDDGYYGFFASRISGLGDWRFFSGCEQFMPGYIWLWGLFFKALGPSLSSLWLYPVLYFTLALALATLAAGRIFSSSFAWIYACLFGFCFWPFFAFYFHEIDLCLVMEYALLLGLWKMAGSLRDPGARSLPWVLGVGFLVGGGWFFTKFWLSSAPIFALMGLTLVRRFARDGGRSAAVFLASVAAGAAPLVFCAVTGRYGAHVQSYFVVLNHSRYGWEQFLNTLSYLTVFLWGPLQKGYFDFGPLWGGYLNPVLGSAFLLGALTLARAWNGRRLAVASLFLLCYMAQGLLSSTREFMRVGPILPFFLLLTSLGLVQLLRTFPVRARLALLAGILVVSTGLDLNQLRAFHQWSVPSFASQDAKSPESYRAFQVLEPIAQKEGPGSLYTDLKPGVFDQTLGLAAYPFDKVNDPRLSGVTARWAAVILPDRYGPALAGLFPGAKAYGLSEGLGRRDEGLSMWVFTPGEKDQALLERWTAAHKVLQSLYPEIPYHQAHPLYGKVLEGLLSHQAEFRGDPVLASCFYAKVADAAWEDGDPELFLKAAVKVRDLRLASGQLTFRMGMVYLRDGEYAKAREHFIEAGRLNEAYRPPPGTLERLDRLQGHSPPRHQGR